MRCPICYCENFSQTIVLKDRLIKEWDLSSSEVDYINKQQGFHCTQCYCNLRSMTLADAIMKHYSFRGTFKQFSTSRIAGNLKVLEINEAGGLHSFLNRFKNLTFLEYPEIDMQNMPYEDGKFDLVVHSDTLEHVENTQLALRECYRILKKNGSLFYTIPIIFGRLTKRRDNLSNSYHGVQDETQGEDLKVITEYGADFWVEIINNGFKKVTLSTLFDTSSFAICATKSEVNIK